VLAIMYMKTEGLMDTWTICHTLYRADDKGFTEKRRMRHRKKGDPYLKDRAIMLLKTHVEKLSLSGLAIMSMKIKGLFYSSHYLYENTGS